MEELRAREAAELALPGVAIGLAGGLIAGGMAAIGGLSLAYVVFTALGLGVPLAVFGAGYGVVLAAGWIRLGGVAPAALYWLPAFPIARLLHETVIDLGSGKEVALPEAVLPFLAYQAMLSLGYTIGFLWLHENLAGFWWLKIRDHNPVAARYVAQYTKQAATMRKREESKG